MRQPKVVEVGISDETKGSGKSSFVARINWVLMQPAVGSKADKVWRPASILGRDESQKGENTLFVAGERRSPGGGDKQARSRVNGHAKARARLATF